MSEKTEHPWTIIIAERGWIYSGKTRREGDRVILESAYVVRRFSLEIKDGLGGLADRGPKKDNDVLDAAPRGIGVYVFAVIADFPCNQEAWDAWHAEQSKAAKK